LTTQRSITLLHVTSLVVVDDTHGNVGVLDIVVLKQENRCRVGGKVTQRLVHDSKTIRTPAPIQHLYEEREERDSGKGRKGMTGEKGEKRREGREGEKGETETRRQSDRGRTCEAL
jgi:hypothetical protein